MRWLFLAGLLLFEGIASFGQKDSAGYHLSIDTILLGNVTVSYTIPLKNSQIVKFYRTNYFSTIDNLTSHLDGVSLIKRGAYAMEPQLNGFSAGQINITIDGMKMFGACTDRMDPVTSYLEPVNLETITLEHLTNGCIHGNNVGGSIDLSLMDPGRSGPYPLQTSVSYGYESVSAGNNLLASAEYSSNRWSWGLYSVYRKNHDYRGGDGNMIPHSQFSKYNINSVVIFRPDTISSFRTDFLWDLAQDVGYPALPMDVKRARAVIGAFEYQRIKPIYNLKARIYYNSVYHLMDDSARDSLFFLGDADKGKNDSVYMRMDMPGWSNTFGTYIQSVIRLNDKNKLTAKAEYYMNSSLAGMTMFMQFPGQAPEPPMYLQTWPDIRRSSAGLYLGNSTTLGSRLIMTLNGRVDMNIDRFMSGVAAEQFSVFNYDLPRRFNQATGSLNMSLQYLLSRPLMIIFQAGYSDRMPTISEKYGFYLYNAYDGYDYIGNPYLKTEKSFSSRLELGYHAKGLKVNLSQTYSRLFDYIMGITDSSVPPMNFYTNGLRRYANFPEAVMLSTGLQAVYSPTDRLTLFMLNKYTWARIDPSTPMPLIPPLKSILSASYEAGKWSFQADNETALSQKRINTAYGETASPAYTIFNIKANYHFMLKRSMFDFSAGITNLLDANYYEHLDWGHIPRQGRSFNFFLKFTY